MSRQRNSLAELQPLAPEAPEGKLEETAPITKDPNARKKVSLYIKQSHYRRIRAVAADRDLMLDLDTDFRKRIVGQQLTLADAAVSITRECSSGSVRGGAIRLRWRRGCWAGARCAPP